VGGSGAQQLAGAEWSNVTLLADMLEYERLLESLRP
jgi:hypothetical protein